ncbi:hypothetical protein GCM10022406_27980 [Hymenobacter algoricola]|uniref:RHS repeat-associated core domain-containing protein n=2 Tax=Hymenobacter algoricola TaxID=486267 RepID=A0ABP7NF40_9BACT
MWQELDGSNYYPAGSLTKQSVVDADGRHLLSYRDQLGRTVLQRKVISTPGQEQFNDTYTVYYESGAVHYTIPPAAVEAMNAAQQWNLSNNAGFVKKWLFQYVHDERGRLVERHFPGQEPVYLVYDAFDRPILVQDGNRRAAGMWYFTKYDEQNRSAVEGIVEGPSTRPEMIEQQQEFTALNPSGEEFEVRVGSEYTTQNTFPPVQEGAGGYVLSQTFYDDYGFDPNGAYSFRPLDPAMPGDPQPTEHTFGLATGTRKRIIQPNNTYEGQLTAVVFYDKYGNVIQKQSNNRLNQAAELSDVTTLVYRAQGFVPQLLRSVKHQETNVYAAVSIRNRFAYDHSGRLLDVWQQNFYKGLWDAEVRVAHHSYNLLGQLVEKNLHSRDNGASYLQSEDFRYNLHGQLSHINNSTLTDNRSTAGVRATNDDTNDIFGLELIREVDNADGLGNTARFDGGITAVRWQAHNASQQHQPERERSYRFSYDGLGRLTDAQFAAKNGTWSTTEVGAFDERNITYDANGNLRTVRRNVQAGPAAPLTIIDNLELRYDGNRLLSVTESGDGARGFRVASTLSGGNGGVQEEEGPIGIVVSTDQYQYDENGNLVLDKNRGVALTYNSLNKIERQKVGTSSVEYEYEAGGAVLRRTVSSARNFVQYDYVDGITYESSPNASGLAWLPTPEGRALILPSTPDQLTYEYQMRDHLGNLRVAFRATAGKQITGLSFEQDEVEGEYPHFRNIATSRADYSSFPGSSRPTVASGSVGTKVGAITNSQPAPTTSVPVTHGEQVKIKVYYSTPYGPQMVRPALTPPTPARIQPQWALVPALVTPQLSSTEKGTYRIPQLAPAVQVSMTGLLTKLAGAHRATPVIPQEARPTNAMAYLTWALYDNEQRLVRSGSMPAQVESNDSWRELVAVVPIDLSSVEARTGQLRVSVLNEGSQPVYFDSLSILHPKAELLVSQENHYYPFGMAIGGVAVNTQAAEVASKQLYNGGSELQDDLLDAENSFYSTELRSYDPTLGRFWGVDPLANEFTSWSPYHFAYNDPINYNDPTGANAQEAILNYQQQYDRIHGAGSYANEGRGGSNAMIYEVAYQNGGAGVGMIGGISSKQVFSYKQITAIFSAPFVQNGKSYSYEYVWKTQVFRIPSAYCENCVNPSTLNNNLLGLSYPGGDNPKDFKDNYSYSYKPSSQVEYPAIGHDRRYDNLKITGAKGLLMDPRSIGADYQFVAESYSISLKLLLSGDVIGSTKAAILGEGLGLAALPKSLLTLAFDQNALFNIAMWYHVSNIGVTNKPSLHKHK